VKPAPFTYHRPRSRPDVDRLLAELGDDAKILAGGQSLVPILNMRLAAPAHLIDINRLEGENDQPVADGGAIAAGPLVRHEAIEHSPLVAERLPLLRETMHYVAHPPIRSRGTVAGSIAHADPAAELPALFALLGGEARARSTRGTRAIAAAELFTSQLETSLADDEWIEEVRFPADPPLDGHAFEEFARRHGDYAVCGVAAAARRANGHADVALSFISMGPTPQRIELPPLAAGELDGDAVEQRVAAAVRDHLEPEADLHATVEYRTALAERLGTGAARRAARMALEEI
jgi:carbon-monoxide dehydrogenase medium subunit